MSPSSVTASMPLAEEEDNDDFADGKYCVSYGSSLSLSDLHHFGAHHCVCTLFCQAPCFLPYITSSVPLPKVRHETLCTSGALNLSFSFGMLMGPHMCRKFSTLLEEEVDKRNGDEVANGTDLFVDGDVGDNYNDDGRGSAGGDSGSDSEKSRERVIYAKEVDRVYKVVNELFASDRNMEAVLNQCNMKVSHVLVVDVLNRFQHAWKPASRFFYWAGQQPGFSHDSQTYNAMMNILGKSRQFESMVATFEEMGKNSVITMETFIIATKAFAAGREMKKAVSIFELMKISIH